MRLVSVVLLLVLVASPCVSAEVTNSEKYYPVFDVNITSKLGSISDEYMNAYQSPTIDVAIKKWEAFLKKNSDAGEAVSVEDLTDLTLIRQAHYELMRLYYLKGRKDEADKLLRKADEFAVYSAPEISGARKWCRSQGHCR